MLVCFLCFAYANAFSQTTGSVSGVLKDSTGNVLEFTAVALLSSIDSSLVKTILTDHNGFTFDNIPFGDYRIIAEYTGYKTYSSRSFSLLKESPKIHLGDIKLEPEGNVLAEVTVTVTKQLVEQKIDRIVLNVEQSIMSNGSTALEVLERAPGVTVDEEGNIALKGKQGVTVMINGKLTYLSQKELTALLRGTASSSIAKIEVIANPSARYDAAGNSGIINIVMKKNIKPGLNGGIYANGGAGRKLRYGSGFNLNYRTGKLNLFGSYDYSFRGEKEYTEDKRTFLSNDHFSSQRNSIQSGTSNEPLNTNNFKAGADYSIDTNNTIGVLVNGNLGTYKNNNRIINNVGSQDLPITSHIRSYNKNDEYWNNVMTNFNYLHSFKKEGRELSADIDYSYNVFGLDQTIDTESQSGFPNPFISGSSRRGNIISKNKIYVGKVDYVHPMGKCAKLESGVKWSYVNVFNDVAYDTLAGSGWVSDAGTTNRFDYFENIKAGYLSYSQEIGKINLQAGVRVEQTETKSHQITMDSLVKRNYIQLFPSAFLSYKINANNQAQLSYSSRIDRPDYGELNPYRYYGDPYLYYEGNPFLKPQLTSSLELSHVFKEKLTTTLNYSNTGNVVTWIARQADSTGITAEYPANLSRLINYGMSISGMLQLTKWFSTNNFLNVCRAEYKDEIIHNAMLSYSFNTQNSFKLGKEYSAEANAFYNSSFVYGMFKTQPMYWLNLGVQKKILKEKGTLKLFVNDVFQSKKFRESAAYGSIRFNGLKRLDSRTVMLSFVYNFGEGSFSKKTKRGSDDDVLKRVKGGE